MDCSLPGSSVHGILQARILEGVSIPFSRVSSWLRDWTWVPCIADRLFTTWAIRQLFFIAEEYSTVFLCVCVYLCMYIYMCICIYMWHLWTVKSLSHVRLFATPWTVAYQAPQSMELSEQEYWSGLPFPSPYVTHIYVNIPHFLFPLICQRTLMLLPYLGYWK